MLKSMFTCKARSTCPAAHRGRVVARSAQKVFTDAEWERALKQASQMKRALYGGEGVGDESGTAQSIPEDQMEFMEPAAGQTFSEAEWERAFKQAPAYLRAMKSDEATDSDADDAAVRTSTAGRDAAGEIAQFELEDAERNKVFAEAEWDRAFSDAGPALEKLKQEQEAKEAAREAKEAEKN